jgi:electron transport complex protein RnfE
MSMKGIAKLFRDGIITQNPVLVLLLGMCSTLAITTSLSNGVGMGVAVTFVLIGSNVVISLIRKIIPSKIRIASFVVVISAFVTTIDLLMQAYTPELSKSMGIFIPLIVVNCIFLARAEAFASKNGVLASAIDGLAMGIGYTLALCIMCVIREILGNGTLLGYKLFGDGFQPILMLILPSGGFLTLGCIIAGMQKLLSLGKGGAK